MEMERTELKGTAGVILSRCDVVAALVLHRFFVAAGQWMVGMRSGWLFRYYYYYDQLHSTAHPLVKIPPIEQTNKRNGIVIGISKLYLNI